MRRDSVKMTAFSGHWCARATVKMRSRARLSASPLALTVMESARSAYCCSSQISFCRVAREAGLPGSSLHSSASSEYCFTSSGSKRESGLVGELGAGEPLAQVLREPPQRGGDGEGRGGQQLAVHEREQGLLARLDGRDLAAAQVLADLRRRGPAPPGWGRSPPPRCGGWCSARTRAPAGAGCGAPPGRAAPSARWRRRPSSPPDLGIHGVAGAEGVLRPEDLLVEQAHQPEELEQIVLQRGGGEEHLRPAGAARPSARGRSCWTAL